jgi:hypothetical protein
MFIVYADTYLDNGVVLHFYCYGAFMIWHVTDLEKLWMSEQVLLASIWKGKISVLY